MLFQNEDEEILTNFLVLEARSFGRPGHLLVLKKLAQSMAYKQTRISASFLAGIRSVGLVGLHISAEP